eukprot:scaffold56832_cov30-Phaeocystis_antarctica.AAC.1
MSAAVHEAISGKGARSGTTARAVPGAARKAEQAESNSSSIARDRLRRPTSRGFRPLMSLSRSRGHPRPSRSALKSPLAQRQYFDGRAVNALLPS